VLCYIQLTELEPPPSYDSVVNDAGRHLSGGIPEMEMNFPAAPVLSSVQQQNVRAKKCAYKQINYIICPTLWTSISDRMVNI